MPRSEFSAPRRRSTTFVNRGEQLRLIGEHVRILRTDPAHFKVFEVVGLGGAGKTRLLAEIRGRTDAPALAANVLWVSLEGEAVATEVAPLLAIREQLRDQCLLFDTALLTYWSATGQPLQVAGESRLSGSMAFRALDVGRGLAGIPLPLNFAVEVHRSLSRQLIKRRRYEQHEFATIDDMRLEPTALRRRLPHYLGLDMNRRARRPAHDLIVFYDGYDKQAPATRATGARWLQEFIATVDRGLHIVATREPLKWGDEWETVVQRVLVGNLPERESRELVHDRLGDVPTPIEDRLVSASHGVPFFLEAAIDGYSLRAGRGEPLSADDLPASPEAAVSHLLEHLTSGTRGAVIALSTVQFFDERAYGHLIRTLHLQVTALEFDDVVTEFFVEPVGAGLFKIHDLLTDFVRRSREAASARTATLRALTTHLGQRCAIDGARLDEHVLPIFGGVLAGWAAGVDIPTAEVEALVDVGYQLYDRGYWHELSELSPRFASNAYHPSAVIAAFFESLCARRISGTGPAIALFERLDSKFEVLGRHARSAEIEIAYLSELSGNYSRARDEFRRLDEGSDSLDSSDRTSLRARLHHADIQLMDGRFVDASRLLLEAAEAVGPAAQLTWAEFVRHRGHTLRFSMMLGEAEDLYLQAMRVVVDAPALLGKLQTNLAETYCWHLPERALEAAALANEFNSRLGSRIELAKSEAARAVALARLGEVLAARDAARRGAEQAHAAGYPAGVAFALQAAAVVEGIVGDDVAVTRCSVDLARTVARLGTYAHLQVVPAWLAGNERAFDNMAADVSWIQPQGLKQRLAAYLGSGDLT